jgi:hypothetical protein
MFLAAAAASHGGFYAKWQLRDDSKTNGIGVMLDMSGERPFVYRQLAPLVARATVAIVPDVVKDIVDRMVVRKFSLKVTPNDSGQLFTAFDWQYQIVKIMSFLGGLLTLFMIRNVLLNVGHSQAVAALVPIASLLSVPYLQTVGGYFYDNIELFFMAAAVWCFQGRRWWLMAALTVLATLNKETFIFFIPCLYPLVRRQLATKQVVLLFSMLLGFAGIVNLAVKFYFSGNPGGAAQVHLIEQIDTLLHWTTFIRTEFTYSLPGPAMLNVISLVFAGTIFCSGYRYLSLTLREFTVAAFVIALPLYFVFCAAGELRNLSFLYVPFSFCLAAILSRQISHHGVDEVSS